MAPVGGGAPTEAYALRLFTVKVSAR